MGVTSKTLVRRSSSDVRQHRMAIAIRYRCAGPRYESTASLWPIAHSWEDASRTLRPVPGGDGYKN